MARFLVKASEFKNVCKAVNDRKLAELKKEIIEILKKQDENEVKKAVDYFNSQELHYTHLEKSLVSGKWIEKAGYGVGTVRIWKGKKYKKIAPGKWARVFDKEGRGTNIAIGKLIARVQKIDNVEDLMAFVMQNKQRFVDENGIDLPVLDKLRAAVDAKNNGDIGSKETTKPAEKETTKYKDVSELEKMSPDSLQEYVDEMHNKIMKMDHEDKGLHDAIETWKNAERIRKEKLHAAHELRSDFETKLMNRLQDGIEKQKEACENWNIAEMSDNQLSEFIKVADKWKDKGLVHLADPIIDKWVDSGKDTYDNNDFVGPAMDYQGFAVAHSKAYDKMKKELESRKKAKDEENKPEKTVEETKETPKEEKTEKIYSVDNSGKVVSFDELQPIASNKSVGENEVQLPYSKDLANEIESLKNCTAPKWEPRDFLKHVYYENGKLITTDARRMKFIEVGELEGIPNGSYVDINTDKSGIKVKKIDVDAQFPNYSKVVPDNLNQTATLDTKLVKDKIKEMYKDGAISKKGSNLVQLEFRDGKVFIDDTAVGEAKDIKMKYSDDWGPARNDTNFMTINADYFVNALAGKTSVMQIGERADKAIAINTGSTSNILMPMSGTDKKTDYSDNRKAKKDDNDKKAEEKLKNKNFNYELLKDVREGKLTSSQVEKVAENIDNKLSSFTDEELQREWARLNYDVDKGFEKKALKSINDIIDKKINLSGLGAIAYSMLKERHPEVKEKFVKELEKRGISVKKSLFDDFIVDVFAADNEDEIEDELYEDETEYNDYSAEQPELFNSTSMKVREAMDRIRNQVL